jgi:hypothetical protein
MEQDWNSRIAGKRNLPLLHRLNELPSFLVDSFSVKKPAVPRTASSHLGKLPRSSMGILRCEKLKRGERLFEGTRSRPVLSMRYQVFPHLLC